MNIAILTIPLHANYGGVLQTFALQQVIMQIGHIVTNIEKDEHLYINTFKLILQLPKRLYTKYILRRRKYIFYERRHNKELDARRIYTSKFIKTNISFKIINDYSIDTEYDTIIVGSDQVWRRLYNWERLEDMFLKFIPKISNIRRIAYAASFGTNEWEYSLEQTKKCSELLSQFDAVSTREIDGIDLCCRYLNRNDAVCTLDPTLLLNKEDYLSLCKDILSPKEKILYAYILDLTDEIKIQLEYIAKSKGIQLKIVRADDNCTLLVEEWIAMFRDSECIITDSFHGTVFSIIFQKEFYSIANIKRGGSRFTSLLSQLGLTDRLFNSISDIKPTKPINWQKVYEKLDILKKKSMDFLIQNLK